MDYAKKSGCQHEKDGEGSPMPSIYVPIGQQPSQLRKSGAEARTKFLYED
jgi:hypothetical protein